MHTVTYFFLISARQKTHVVRQRERVREERLRGRAAAGGHTCLLGGCTFTHKKEERATARAEKKTTKLGQLGERLVTGKKTKRKQ